jgi:hypothetical protein
VSARLSERERDRRVRRLMACGRTPSLGEVMDLCLFRSLLAYDRQLNPADIAATTTCAVVLGFTAEDLTAEMRADILRDLRAGRMVLLLSNKRELRDYAKREIGLALATPANAVVA